MSLAGPMFGVQRGGGADRRSGLHSREYPFLRIAHSLGIPYPGYTPSFPRVPYTLPLRYLPTGRDLVLFKGSLLDQVGMSSNRGLLNGPASSYIKVPLIAPDMTIYGQKKKVRLGFR